MTAGLGIPLAIAGIAMCVWFLADSIRRDASWYSGTRDAADPDKEQPPPGWPGGLDHRSSPAKRARIQARARGGQ